MKPQIYHLWEKIIEKSGINLIIGQTIVRHYHLQDHPENVHHPDRHQNHPHQKRVRHENHQRDLRPIVHTIDHLVHPIDHIKNRISFSNIIFNT